MTSVFPTGSARTGTRTGSISTYSALKERKKQSTADTLHSSSRHRRLPSRPRELSEAGLSARKSLGQHFLRDRRVLQRIVAAAKLSPEETAVEVGAGSGTLTAQLLKRAAKVVAVEVDRGLCDHLRQRFKDTTNLSLVCADILSLTPSELLRQGDTGPPYVVVANLPYYIAAPVLRLFLEAAQPPSRMIVMMQKEVAESVVAAPGRMSLLGLSVQFYASPRLLFTVPPSAFYPPPKVHSAVLRIELRERPAVEVGDADDFFRFLRAGFSAPRKQLRNVLSHALATEPASVSKLMTEAGVDPRLRAQALNLGDWARLYAIFSTAGLHKSQEERR